MFRIPKTLSQIDVSASLNSYLFPLPHAPHAPHAARAADALDNDHRVPPQDPLPRPPGFTPRSDQEVIKK